MIAGRVEWTAPTASRQRGVAKGASLGIRRTKRSRSPAAYEPRPPVTAAVRATERQERPRPGWLAACVTRRPADVSLMAKVRRQDTHIPTWVGMRSETRKDYGLSLWFGCAAKVREARGEQDDEVSQSRACDPGTPPGTSRTPLQTPVVLPRDWIRWHSIVCVTRSRPGRVVAPGRSARRARGALQRGRRRRGRRRDAARTAEAS